MKQHQVAGGEPLFRCCCSSLSVCPVSPTNGIISSEFKPLLPLPLQPFLLPALLFTSISLSPSPLPSLSLSLLPAPGPQTAWLNTQANVSLFKETQVVDTLAMGHGKKMKSYCGALWLHFAPTSLNPYYGGPHSGPRAFPQGKLKYGP